MPVYTYRCENCGHQFDKHQSFAEEPLKVCPACQKHRLHKVYFPAGVSFKGSGFYVTDKRNGSSPTASSPAKGEENGAKETAAKEAPAEKKPEAKPPAAAGEKAKSVSKE
jgi:putative FmdB family regulatory protein